MIWARNLDPVALVTNLVLTAYLLVGTLLEERKLIAEFGEAYRSYQREVSMLLPIRFLRSRARRLLGR